jgi:hypothetical protein
LSYQDLVAMMAERGITAKNLKAQTEFFSLREHRSIG